MRNPLIKHYILLIVLSLFLGSSSFAQKAKKNKVRLKANYVKVMNSEVYFDLQATAKVNGENITIPNVELVIYNVVDDEQIELGKATTNMLSLIHI